MKAMEGRTFGVMFVCAGNICRSPLAEAVFCALAREAGVYTRFRIASSGTTGYHVGQQADKRMRAVAAGHGITIDHRARLLRRDDLASFDLILVMDKTNYEDVADLTQDRDLLRRVHLFREFDPDRGSEEVPDPYYGGTAGFEEVYRIVRRTAAALLDFLLDRTGRQAGDGPDAGEEQSRAGRDSRSARSLQDPSVGGSP